MEWGVTVQWDKVSLGDGENVLETVLMAAQHCECT